MQTNEIPIILITGTRKGIGHYLVEYYIQKGFYVIGCSRQAVEYQHSHYQHFCLDITDEFAVKKMFSVIRKKYARLDILVNNAGMASSNHSLLTPISTVQAIFNTNVVGAFLFCREAAKLMKKHHQGRIINLASVAVLLKVEGEAIYTASKAAIISLTETLAKEFAEFGITVNAVAPPPLKTDFIHSIPQEKIHFFLERQAIGRFCEFEDISNVIDFFIQPQSHFVTGQNIFLGGV